MHIYGYHENKIGQLEASLATLGGLYFSDYATEKLSSVGLKPVMKNFYSLPEINEKDAFTLVNSMLKNNEKKLKELSIIKVTHDGLENLKTQFNNKKPSFWEKIFKKSDIIQKFEDVANGRNAFFVPKTNEIYAPVNKPTMLLHEIGHAVNSKAFWGAKYLQIAGAYLPKIAPVFILSSAIYDSLRTPDKQSFVKNNAGWLTMACFIPTLIDEATASLRVIRNSVKNNLSKSIIKNQKKFLGLAFCSYLGLTVASGIVATGVVKLASLYSNWRNKN